MKQRTRPIRRRRRWRRPIRNRRPEPRRQRELAECGAAGRDPPPLSNRGSGCSCEEADQREQYGDDQHEEQELGDRNAAHDRKQQEQRDENPEQDHDRLLVVSFRSGSAWQTERPGASCERWMGYPALESEKHPGPAGRTSWSAGGCLRRRLFRRTSLLPVRWEVGRGAVACVAVAALICGWAGSSGGASLPPSTWPTFGAGTSRAGYTPISASRLSRAFVLPLSGRITSQILAADGLFFATSNAGDVVAFDRNGYVRWRQNAGQLAHSCQQLDGYGIVGTGVIDPAAHTLYAVDAFARLHAYALSSGVERPGWPIRLFPTFTEQIDWGALTLAGGSVYVPTASYCDTPLTSGGVHAVDLATRAVTRWRVVPKE